MREGQPVAGRLGSAALDGAAARGAELHELQCCGERMREGPPVAGRFGAAALHGSAARGAGHRELMLPQKLES
eukprot:10321437-Alexandrium_andersonii.AAC.1